MANKPRHPYIIEPGAQNTAVDEGVTICISRSRLRFLMSHGYLVASDFKCINNCAKCVVRELLMECAASDLAANE
ncbi:hypothetical protein CWE12_07280 [Aliidiomarina sedimenti]|uniref:Uncharacterized protein n=1 Tax=Aliidiomarina sedimenti TaxID=1933879 RepID=A0ABY0BYC5_9GAMM|nr:hypothetical protein [Aliidiomarina sedimenti]RUO29766.1 hypothetical protein CWE12_07280 [Aliidiomarina sedimenti]